MRTGLPWYTSAVYSTCSTTLPFSSLDLSSFTSSGSWKILSKLNTGSDTSWAPAAGPSKQRPTNNDRNNLIFIIPSSSDDHVSPRAAILQRRVGAWDLGLFFPGRVETG